MPDDTQDVNADPSPATDVNADPSTAAPVETPTSKVEPEQVVPYDRFKEVADEKNYWREQAMRISQNQPTAQPVTQQQPDPYAGMDANTKVFWQEVDKRSEQTARKLVAEKETQYQATIDALVLQNAKVQEKLFRNEAKDVVAGSPEEREIANLIRMGLDPDRAAMAVMGEKRIAAAKSEAQVKQQLKTQDKAKAAIDTPSMPVNNGIPTKEKLSFRETLARKMQAVNI